MQFLRACSKLKTSHHRRKKKKPYPRDIEINTEKLHWEISSYEKEEAQTCHQKQDDVEFWKEKARKLEDVRSKLEARAKSLDKVAFLEAPNPTFQSRESPMGRSSLTSSCASIYNDPAREEEDQHQRQQLSKDEVKHQLVLEMERIIQLNSDGNDWQTNSSISIEPGDENASGNLTSALQELVSRVLAADMHNQALVLYQLSCRGESVVCWTKRCDLNERVEENFSCVWQLIQTAYGKGNGGVGVQFKERNLSFRASSFAHHVANQCQYCDSEEEVIEWCLYNVKVDLIL